MDSSTPEVDHYGSQYSNFATELYAEIRAETYDQDIGQNGWLTAEEQDLLIGWLDLQAGSRLLDVACGSGGPTLRIAALTGSDVVGIDLHADGIRAAKAAAEQRGLGNRATFQVADGSARLPFGDEHFDALMCIDAVNHLPDRPRVFAEWNRVLKPGGRLVFTDPIVVTGPLTNEEMRVRSSIGFFLFVPDGSDDEMLDEAGFAVKHREDRTPNMAEMAANWRDARGRRAEALQDIEGSADYDGQQVFFEMCARLASERRLSRIAYCAIKS